MNMDISEQELTLKLFITFSKAHRAVFDLVKEDIKQYGLNQTEFAVLELLYNKGDQPLQQIGQKILLASGTITYVVDKLEEKGYLERKACPNDRRITFATITEKGTILFDDIFPKHQQRLQEIFSCLSMEEKEFGTQLMKKLGLHAETLA
jgi:MarR family transcriptional regulator, 2-MHQ and catechol-resistance regulon repressor